MAHVRDRPSLRESVEITTPSGNRYRWSDDEDSPANVPSGERFTDTMPGGFAEHEAVLPRKPSVDYADLERLSTLTRYDASGGIIWQGRLERAPKVSGDQVAISPSAVGWQAHLEDDKSATMVYRDCDLSRWQGVSVGRRVIGPPNNLTFIDGQVRPNPTTGQPGIALEVVGAWAATARPYMETWYDAGSGNLLASMFVAWDSAGVNHADANWSFAFGIYSNMEASAGASTIDLAGVLPPSFSGYNAPTPLRCALIQFLYATGPAGADNFAFTLNAMPIVYGDHGLTLRGTEPDAGFYASDIVTHAVGRWAPLLTATTETITQSAFVIPQAAFPEPTTAAEIIRQATRFGLQDWAVWEDLTFWWHDRGARGNQWRARTGPSQLEETGPQVERIWESVIVQYQDVDGSTRTVGPTGSGADAESADLKDDDPDNPANRLGITRRDLLVMGIGTTASATEVGRRFLEESRLLDSSGRARLVGHVQDSHGTWHPYSHVRAGDTISFVDSSDTSYRRIVRTDKTRDDRSCGLDLDAPPEGLAALLERLGVVLVPLGI